MKYSFNILAAALAVGLFTLPAYAAVSDVEGGEIHVNTTINKHYNEIDGGTTVVQGADKHHQGQNITNVSKQYKGYIDYNAHGTNWGGHQEGWTAVRDNPGSVEKDLREYVVATNYPNQYTGEFNDRRCGVNIVGSDGAGNCFYYVDKHGNYTTNAGSAWYKEDGSVNRTERHSDFTGVTYSDVYERTDKTETELTGITSSRKVTPGKDSIVIGDPDAIASAYAAQGNVTVDEVVDKYYDRTHYYEQQRHNNYEDYTVTTVNEVWVLHGYRYYSPIILDLDGDGKIEASNGQYLAHDGFSQNVAVFDFFGNGFPVLTEWVGANDGLLCRPTKDGKVTGAQLFGTANGMGNGYEEMASLDADASGALEGAELEGLYVWTDLNRNAIADKGELKSVQELGITSIKVTHNNYASTFTRNGQTYKTFDWWPNCREMRKVNVAGIFE